MRTVPGSELSRAEIALRAGVSACCAYEIFAISTRRIPTISHVCRKHRWIEAGMTVAWLTHIHLEKYRQEKLIMEACGPSEP
jgi:hypothetical protein